MCKVAKYFICTLIARGKDCGNNAYECLENGMSHEKTRALGLAICILGVILLVHFLLPVMMYDHDTTDAILRVLSNSRTESNSNWHTSLSLYLLAPNDSSQLLNITHFKFLINPACSDSLYIVCVFSATDNIIKRQLIRNSWGAHVPVYFFVGKTTPENQTLLDAESSMYHDLVQGTFNDTYRNLTYKHTMVFKWVVYHCPNIKYVIKCDDDIFINVGKLTNFLTHNLSPHGTRNLLMCPEIYYHDLAVRAHRSKWRVTYAEYPERYYPPHCHGPVLLYSPDMMFKLYRILQTEQKFFWIDDVFITGVVFADLKIFSHSNFNWWLGNTKSLLPLNDVTDVPNFDPNKNLFAFLSNDNEIISKIVPILSNVTFGHKNK